MDNFLLVKLQDNNGYCIVHASKCKIDLFEAEFVHKEKRLRGTIVLNGKLVMFNFHITF